jgi:erythromycin esterase
MRFIKKLLLIWLIFCLAACASIPHKPVGSSIPFYPLNSAKDLDPLINAVGDNRIVLLGEASHGTAEYYTWRAEISKRLIQEKGFNLIAVEGDWTDFYRLNDFFRGTKSKSYIAHDILSGFTRWPAWLWANKEFENFSDWLYEHNNSLSPGNKTGIYGLDLFNFYNAVEDLYPLLTDTISKNTAKELMTCLQKHSKDAVRYTAVASALRSDCSLLAEKLWKEVVGTTGGKPTNEKSFIQLQNAAVARNGEYYFRTRFSQLDLSWNRRDQHMH